MAFVVPILAAVAAAATTAALTASIGIVLASVAGVAVAFGISTLGNALFPVKRPSAGTDAFSRTQQVRQPISAHRVIYGRARVSGPLVFIHTNAAARTSYTSQVNGAVAADYRAEQLLYLAHVIAGHEIAAVETVLIDDLELTDERFRGAAYVSWGVGTTTQTANAMLVAETDGQWTTAHRLRGRAYLASVLKYDETAFPSGIPNISVIARGRLVYDPRTDATGWSNNAAIVVADYITSDFGLRASWDEIHIPTLVASANICDEAVTLAAGGTEPRYTCSGTFDLDEAPAAILEKLLSSMAGTAVFVGGKWYIHAGAWQAPTATITEDMLRAPVVVRANRPARDLWNGVRAVYVRPAAGWQPTDAPPLQDATALAQDDGIESYTDLPLDFTVSGYRAQRLMQIALRRNRLQRQIVAPLNMSGLAIRSMDTVTVRLPRLPEDTYRVTRWALSPEGGVDVTLEQDAASVYAWDETTDERELGDVGSLVFPGGASLTAPTVSVTTPTSASPASIAITWGAISGAGSYEAQARDPDSSVWVDLTEVGTGATATSSMGRLGFRVRARSGEDFSNWSEVTIPPAPTVISVWGTATGYDVTFTLQSDAVRGQIFIGTTDTYSSSTVHGVEPAGGTTSITDGSGTPKYVWVRFVRADGNFGPPQTPILVTPGNTATGGAYAPTEVDPSSGSGDGDSGSDGGSGDGDGGDGGGGDGGE